MFINVCNAKWAPLNHQCFCGDLDQNQSMSLEELRTSSQPRPSHGSDKHVHPKKNQLPKKMDTTILTYFFEGGWDTTKKVQKMSQSCCYIHCYRIFKSNSWPHFIGTSGEGIHGHVALRSEIRRPSLTKEVYRMDLWSSNVPCWKIHHGSELIFQ